MRDNPHGKPRISTPAKAWKVTLVYSPVKSALEDSRVSYQTVGRSTHPWVVGS